MTRDRETLQQEFPDTWRWIRIGRRIGGWLTDKEANALFELTRDRAPHRNAVVVELGSWLGKSSVLLAAGMRHKQNPRLFCVDPFGSDQGLANQEKYYAALISKMRRSPQETFHRNIRRCGLSHLVNAVKGYSFEVIRSWSEPIDILFIDASHDYEAVHCDVMEWAPLVKIGGTIALHDVSPTWPGPSRVMAEDLQPPYFEELDQADSLTWAVKRSAGPLPEGARRTRIFIPKNDFDRRQQEIARLSSELHATKAALSSAQQVLGDLRHAKDRLANELNDFANQLAEARRAEEALRGSWEWRVTAPLRLLRDCPRLLSIGRAGALQRNKLAGVAQWLLYRKRILESGLFDRSYYLKQNPDVARLRINPLLHYFVFGSVEGRNPHYLFDVRYYLALNRDLARSYLDPLVHYLKWGAYEGRNPHPHFNSSSYLDENPDVKEAGLNPLVHYLAPGIAEGRDPNYWFDTSEYLEQHPNVAAQGLNPLIHCLEQGSGAPG